MIYLYIFLLLIVIVLVMPIKIRVIRNDKHNDVDIFFVKLFNKRLDLDELYYKLLSDKRDNKITINSILYNLGLFIKSYSIIRNTCKMVEISKLTIVSKTKSKKEENQVYSSIVFWNTISYTRSFLMKNFKKVSNEYYSMQIAGDDRELSFELRLNFRLIYLLISVFTNYKDIPKIIKFHKKGSENNA